MTTLRAAAQQALEALKNPWAAGPEGVADAITTLRAALAEHDKRMEWYRERKANWDLQRQLVSETEERDRQRREYEEERLAALAETPTNQCGETCDRAKLCAVCARGLVDGDKASPAVKESLTTEPVAWMDIADDGTRLSVRQWSDGNRDEVPLYTAPPQRKPLSGLEMERLLEQVIGSLPVARRLVRAVEAAHGIKP